MALKAMSRRTYRCRCACRSIGFHRVSVGSRQVINIDTVSIRVRLVADHRAASRHTGYSINIARRSVLGQQADM
jgi:hypothetical protein